MFSKLMDEYVERNYRRGVNRRRREMGNRFVPSRFDKIQGLAMSFSAAFRAGWIANGCDDCVVDDEQEMIVPCEVHAAKIEKLLHTNLLGEASRTGRSFDELIREMFVDIDDTADEFSDLMPKDFEDVGRSLDDLEVRLEGVHEQLRKMGCNMPENPTVNESEED